MTLEDTIKEWTDRELISEVHEVDHKGIYEFSLYLKTGAYSIHVYEYESEGPVIVSTSVNPGPDLKTMLIDHPDRNHVETLLISVLTNSPGRYAILDEEGKPCTIEEADRIKLGKRLYLDSITQQQFMDSVTGVMSSGQFCAKILNRFGVNIEEGR